MKEKIIEIIGFGMEPERAELIAQQVLDLFVDADKALAILRAFHDIAHNSEKNEGLTITKDWDKFTLTIFTKDGHVHLGQMNHEDDGFPILINEMYNHFCK